MVLHTTFAGMSVSTTGGTTYDTVAAANYFPVGDNEIQARGGGLPQLIGIDTCEIDETPVGAGSTNFDFWSLRCNTWPTADYFGMRPQKFLYDAAAKSQYGAGDGQPIWNLPGQPMDQDSDWEVRLNSTTASKTVMGAIYLSYGTRHPYKGGKLISRDVDFAGGTDGAYPAQGTLDTITDLDPRFIYRLAGMQLTNVEDQVHIGLYVTSSSNNTTVGALCPSSTSTTFHPCTIPVWFPHDSILIAGNETVSVGSFSTVAQNPAATIFFEKYGTVAGLTGGTGLGGGIPGGGSFGGGAATGGGAFGGIMNLFGR